MTARPRPSALFIETLRDPAAFARAMRAMHDAGKPVIALKVGRSAKGAAASAAHTGSLAGNWDAYQAYFRRHGVIAVDDFDELAESVELALKVRVPPQGDGVAVIAVSGGETSLVADLAERAGVRLPELAPETVARLRTVLPAFGSIGNPLDTTDRGVYDAQNVYSGSIRALADDPSVSLVAVVQDCSPGLSARGANNYRRIAQTVADAAREIAKPVVFFNTAAGGHACACDRAVRRHQCCRHAGRAREPAGHRSSLRACAFRAVGGAANACGRSGLARATGDRHALHGAGIEGVSGRAWHSRHARDARAGCRNRRSGRRRDRVPGGAEDRVARPAAQDRGGRRARRPRRCCRGRGGLR